MQNKSVKPPRLALCIVNINKKKETKTVIKIKFVFQNAIFILKILYYYKFDANVFFVK